MIKYTLITIAVSLFSANSIIFAEENHNHQQHEKKTEHDEHKDFIEISKSTVKNAGIFIATAKEGRIAVALNLPGEVAVNGDSLVHIAPRFAGTLKKVTKHLGEEVKVGELLAIVQSNESLSTYDIRAETSGVVIDKDASVGEFVTNDKILFTIADFKTVWVNAAVHLADLRSIEQGATVTVHSKSTQHSQKSTISYIRPTLSETTRTALARVVLTNQDAKWLPGMFVNVNVLRSGRSPQVIIPSESAVFIDNQFVVFVESRSSDGGYGFEKRVIEVGVDNGEELEALQGLAVGETVAAGETFILKAELGKGSAGHNH